MFTRNRLALLGAASLTTLTVGGTPVLAQSQAAQNRGIEVITVTTQKREESIQDVPIALTALSAEDLEAAKIEDLLDLQFNAPNIILSANRNLTIRGVGSQSFGGSNDAGVGALINGVFIQAPLTTQEYFDLERIEVSRGPQGTLQGRNTTGGTINYISRRAEDDFGGYLSAQLESFSGVRVNGAVNVPVTDNLYQRFAFNYLNRDGYTENLFDDSRLDGRNQWAVRSSTRYQPTSNTTADLVLEFLSENSDRGGALKSLCTPDPALGCSSDSVSTAFPTSNFLIDLFLIPGITRGDKFVDNPSDLREVVIDINPTRDVEEFVGSFEVSHDFGDLTLTSVTGYRRGTLRSSRDFDQGFAPAGFNPGTFFTALGPVTVPDDGQGNGILTYLVLGKPVTTTQYNTSQIANTRAKQLSTELRLHSDYDSWFNFLLGAYYLDFEYRGEVTTYSPAALTAGFVASGNTPKATTESYAVFGEAYIDITDTLQLIGGLRYTIDDKTINTASGTFALGAPFIDEESFNELTWRAALTWSPDLSFTDDTNIYVSASRGFKSGGFNPGTENASGFESEFVTSYEIGLKNLMFDNRLQTNVAAFIYDYENLIVGNIVGTLAQNVNLPSSEVMGIEVEAIAEPIAGLRFEGALGILDSEVESDFLSSDPARGGTFFQLQGNSLPNTPGMTLKLAAEYTHEFVPGWIVRPRVDFYTQSDYYSREFNTEADNIDSWKQLDLQVAFAPLDQDLQLTLFVKNVLDEDSITHLEANSNLVGSFRSAFLLDPRIIGATVDVSF